jgi:hypothetical protein
MWQNGPYTLLVGLHISTTVTGSSMEIPQEAENGPAIWSSDTTPGHLLKRNVSQDTTETSAH